MYIHLVEVLGGWLAYNIVMTAQSPKVSCQELKKSPCLCVIFLNSSLSLHKSCSDLSLSSLSAYSLSALSQLSFSSLLSILSALFYQAVWA